MEQICKITWETFVIRDEDIKIYERLWVSPPDISPNERQKVRMSWRNDRVFYNRTCDFSGDKIIAMYPEKTIYPVYHPDIWWSDKWNAMDYALEYDESKSFFEQWQTLLKKVPRPWVDLVNCENSLYCNYCGDDKNCYLDIAWEWNEECYYNLFTKYSNYSADGTFVYHSENMYECINCYKSYNLKYCKKVADSSDCLFSYDLKGCKHCVLSSGLRNKSYCIENIEYSKQEYEKKIKEMDLGDKKVLETYIKAWHNLMESSIHKYAWMLNCDNVVGDDLADSKNVYHGFNVWECEDCSYLYDVLEAKKCVDLNYSLYHPESSMELISTLNLKLSAFNCASHFSTDIFYCQQCDHSNNLFGCIWLQNKEYCILNKQYTKEEYEDLKEKIITKMKQDWEWWKFFPASMSPFGYNETVAQEYFPLDKQTATSTWFNWSDYEPPLPEVEKIIPANKLPDHINDIPDDILNWAIRCEITDKPFRIISQELKFYRKHNLPVPRRHPDTRHADRAKLRNPRELFDRTCDKCNKEIQSTYSPDRKEIVYCEECYHWEIY